MDLLNEYINRCATECVNGRRDSVSGHTPGPWTFRQSADRKGWLVESELGGIICDLLEALKAIADPKTPDNLGEPFSRLILAQQIALRAIVKAEGKLADGKP